MDLLLKTRYGGSRADAGQAIGKGGDEGIDGVTTTLEFCSHHPTTVAPGSPA